MSLSPAICFQLMCRMAVMVGLALGTTPAAPVATPVVVTSSSQQITVRGLPSTSGRENPSSHSDLIVLDPSLLVVTAESIRQALRQELHWSTEWQGRIFIDLHAIQYDNEPGTLCSLRTSEGWNYRLEMPDEMAPSDLVRAVVEALVVEYANRPSTTHLIELPPWLVPGLTACLEAGVLDPAILAPHNQLQGGPPDSTGLRLSPLPFRTRVKSGPVRGLHDWFRTNSALTIDQLNWPAPEQLEGEGLVQYDASAHLLVHHLLRLRDGPDCLRQTLVLLPNHLNWQSAFLRAFQGHFPRLLDFEKWWALTLIGFTGRDASQIWDLPASRQRLDEILYTPVQVRLTPDEEPHESQVSLETVLTDWTPDQQLAAARLKLAELAELRQHACPEVQTLGQGYGALLETIAQSKTPLGANQRAKLVKELEGLDVRRARLWNPPPPNQANGPASHRGLEPSGRGR